MTPEKYREELLEIHYDITRTRDVISALHHTFEEIIDFSPDSVHAIIRLISDDIGMQCDHINRILEGKCSIRHADPSELRPPVEREKAHTNSNNQNTRGNTP